MKLKVQSIGQQLVHNGIRTNVLKFAGRGNYDGC